MIHDGPNALLIFRLGAVSATILGIVSLFLTLVGLYGVMSVGVTQRTRELGVRLALGATPGQVRRSVLRQAALLAGLGVAAGIPLSVGAVAMMRSLLVGGGVGGPVGDRSSGADACACRDGGGVSVSATGVEAGSGGGAAGGLTIVGSSDRLDRLIVSSSRVSRLRL